MVAVLAMCACGSTSTNAPAPSPSAPSAPSTPTVASIAVSGTAPTVGSTSQLTATATLSNGSTEAVTTQATWQSSNAAVLTVNSSGLAMAIAAGDADLTATYAGVKGSLHLSVAPRTLGLIGVIADETTRGALADVRVEVLNGINGGKVASTDASGTYTFTGLVAETFRLRASKDGYAWGEQNVTVPDVPRADFFLHQACSVSVSPTFDSMLNGPFGSAISVSATPSSCPWNASTSDDWITLMPPTSGTGSSTIYFRVIANMPVTASRTGSILVSWSGGNTRVTIEQRPATCTPSDTFAVAASGRGWMFDLGAGCYFNTTMSVDVPWIHIGRDTHGGGLFIDVTVDPNSGAQRIGHITMDGHGNGLYAQYTFVQAHP